MKEMAFYYAYNFHKVLKRICTVPSNVETLSGTWPLGNLQIAFLSPHICNIIRLRLPFVRNVLHYLQNEKVTMESFYCILFFN